MFHARFKKIMKFVEFHYIITKNHENLIIPRQNHENHEILRIPCQNRENHENLMIRRLNHENNEVHITPLYKNEKQ